MQRKVELLTKWLKDTNRSDFHFDEERAGSVEQLLVDGQVEMCHKIGGWLEEILEFSDEQISKELDGDIPLEIKGYKFNMRDVDSVNIAVEFIKGKSGRTVTGHLNLTTNMAHLSVDEDEVEKTLESWGIELDEIEKRIESRDIELI